MLCESRCNDIHESDMVLGMQRESNQYKDSNAMSLSKFCVSHQSGVAKDVVAFPHTGQAWHVDLHLALQIKSRP